MSRRTKSRRQPVSMRSQPAFGFLAGLALWLAECQRSYLNSAVTAIETAAIPRNSSAPTTGMVARENLRLKAFARAYTLPQNVLRGTMVANTAVDETK